MQLQQAQQGILLGRSHRCRLHGPEERCVEAWHYLVLEPVHSGCNHQVSALYPQTTRSAACCTPIAGLDNCEPHLRRQCNVARPRYTPENFPNSKCRGCAPLRHTTPTRTADMLRRWLAGGSPSCPCSVCLSHAIATSSDSSAAFGV